MVDYYVELDTSVVDGSAYTSNDTIIIRAGVRGDLVFKNFNGDGLYITITNENATPSSKVQINTVEQYASGVLNLLDCKYVDLRGDNDSNLEFGIKVINDGVTKIGNTILVYGESDHIKLSYLEATCEGNTTLSGNGIHVEDLSLTSDWIYDDFEIHHNYIHNTRFSGLYLGLSMVQADNTPYYSNGSIHDNILEDLGSYGITVGGINENSGMCSIYNNTIRGSLGGQSTGLVTPHGDSFSYGISVKHFYGTTYANIYNNRIEKTVGPGIQVGDQKHNIYNNIILGCGLGNNSLFGHGIITFQNAFDIHIYDNIIIQPTRYGIYALSITISALMSRNLIGDAGLGAWGEQEIGDLTESTGENANWYENDVANFGFKAWSNDGYYSNDDFTIETNLCEDVICSNICVGPDLYSQQCNLENGECELHELLKENSLDCGYVPPNGDKEDNTIIILGGLVLVALAMLKNKK